MNHIRAITSVLLVLFFLVGIVSATEVSMWGLAGLPLNYYADLIGPWAGTTFFQGKFTMAPYIGEDSSYAHAYLTGVGGIGASFADRIEFAIATSMYFKRLHGYHIAGDNSCGLQYMVMNQWGLGDTRISLKGKILNQVFAKFDLGVIAYLDLPTGASDITHRNDEIQDDPLNRRALNNLTDGKKTYNLAIIEALSRSFMTKEDPCFKYDRITFTSNVGFVIQAGTMNYSTVQSDYILSQDPCECSVDPTHIQESPRADYFLMGAGIQFRPLSQLSAFFEGQFKLFTAVDSDSALHPEGKAARHLEMLFGVTFNHSDYYHTTVAFGKTFGMYHINYTTGEPVDDNYNAYVLLNADVPTKGEDSDEDGMPDCTDPCPYEAEDFDGWQDSDGCPDPDNDGDGILDVDDDCPNDPEDFDGWEDSDGCPDPDNDGDGILDVDDDCPNIPETFNGYEDEDGCPDEAPMPEEKRMILRDIRFEPDSATMLPGSYESLEKAGQTLVDFPNITVTIEGHAADTGRPEFEQTLSEQRALTVKNYLVDRYNVERSRISTIGFGSSRPISTIKAENRRIEFIVDE